MQPHTSSHTTLTATCTTSSASTCSRGTTGATGGLKAHRRSLTCAVMVRPHALLPQGWCADHVVAPACLLVTVLHLSGLHRASCAVDAQPWQAHRPWRVHWRACIPAAAAGRRVPTDMCTGHVRRVWLQRGSLRVARPTSWLRIATLRRFRWSRRGSSVRTGARFVALGLPALTLPSLLRCGFACSQAGGPGRV